MNKETLGPEVARGMYRDRENGWIFGVCAGVADYFNVPILLVRMIAAAGLLLYFWATVITYTAATLFLRVKPLTWSGHCREYDFWRRNGSDDRWSHS